jgi:hypothetical protein
MPEVSKDVLVLIYKLLPGFLTAWVFFGLTAHKRGNPFERVVQALVYSVFIQIPVELIRMTLLGLGGICSVGPWTEEIALFYSLPIAIGLGLAFAWVANNNVVHKRLYKWGVSTRTSYPTELFGLVKEDARRFVVLHLKDGRRLYGWPYEWPDYQDEGRFIIVQAEWLTDENESRPLTGVEKVILPASAVEMVETMEPQTRSRAAENSDEEPV